MYLVVAIKIINKGDLPTEYIFGNDGEFLLRGGRSSIIKMFTVGGMDSLAKPWIKKQLEYIEKFANNWREYGLPEDEIYEIDQ